MSERKPKVRYVKTDHLKRKDPWKRLREKPGVTIQSTARRDP